MTYTLEIGDRRRLKAGIRVLHHTGHRAPCSGERLISRHGAQPVLSPHRPRKTRRHPRTGKRRRLKPTDEAAADSLATDAWGQGDRVAGSNPPTHRKSGGSPNTPGYLEFPRSAY